LDQEEVHGLAPAPLHDRLHLGLQLGEPPELPRGPAGPHGAVSRRRTAASAASESGPCERSPEARSFRSTVPAETPRFPTTTWTGNPIRSASANFTPAEASRSSRTVST